MLSHKAISIIIQASIFIEIHQLFLKFLWKYKGTRILKTILQKKNKVGKHIPTVYGIYYKATVISLDLEYA